MMKDLISDIVKALVDQPDQVSVNEVEGGHTVVLELSVAKSDMGKVIGKRGRNALACGHLWFPWEISPPEPESPVPPG